MPILVEVNMNKNGLPSWNMVGLLETAVKEAKDRVAAAISNSGLKLPSRKTIINFAPAHIKKSGTQFDLAIAIGLLEASEQIHLPPTKKIMIVGELSLSGRIQPINGVFLMALAAKKIHASGMVVPMENAWEAKLAGIKTVFPAASLGEAIGLIQNCHRSPTIKIELPSPEKEESRMDLSDVKGQPLAKRGLEIAAAGGHNIALKGPPGTGKTMLAKRMPSILPYLTELEQIDVLKIQSIHGALAKLACMPRERPFRAPHHSASYAGLIGGGNQLCPRIGELSLAHHGILFLDEFPEFRRDVIEVLREPMESGIVRVVRANLSIVYPANFILICAFNPCKCGYLTHPSRMCTCSLQDIRRYQSKLSGPLMDRIDIHIEVGPPSHSAIMNEHPEQSESSIVVRKRVNAAHSRQRNRNSNHKLNAQLSAKELMQHCQLSIKDRQLFSKISQKYHLSARSMHRVLKLARTIADLDIQEKITFSHINEAIGYRPSIDDII